MAVPLPFAIFSGTLEDMDTLLLDVLDGWSWFEKNVDG